MQVNFVHFCDRAFFSETKKLSVIEVFDIVTSPRLPALHPGFSLVLNISGEIEEETRVVINAPSGEEIYSLPIEKDAFPEGKSNNTVVINIVNFMFPEEGNYRVFLKAGTKTVSPERNDSLLLKLEA